MGQQGREYPLLRQGAHLAHAGRDLPNNGDEALDIAALQEADTECEAQIRRSPKGL